MADITFIVHSEWLENISELPVEQQDKIIAEIIRYGTGLSFQHSDDVVVQAFVNMLKGRIDYSKDKYANKVEKGKNGGSKNKKIDEDEVSRLAKEGKKSQEIADILGCSKSTIDHCEAWRQRNNEGAFCF